METHIVTQEELTYASVAWESYSTKPLELRERVHPILPKDGDGERNILVTSALPYVNNVPHLGNIVGCVLSADVYSRFCRLRNYNVIYICGTDEYGTATEAKAQQEGLTEREICDKYHAIHSQVYDWFNINFDKFGRTSAEYQTQIAQDIFKKCDANGFISEDIIQQYFCESCDTFLADRFVEGKCPHCNKEGARGDQCDDCGKLIGGVDLVEPKCQRLNVYQAKCGHIPTIKESNHLFLELPKLESVLRDYSEKSIEEGKWSTTASSITRTWLKEGGLNKRCITRDLKWGIPVPKPGFEKKVFYVWYDAPIGYPSITAAYTSEWEKWWKNPKNVQLYQFMAKDNVPFHSVIFPACLIAANDNYTLLHHLSAVEYLQYENTKFSKSRGTGVFGDMAKDTGIEADVYRFYLLSIRPETQDSSFTWNDLAAKNNGDLLNNLGNFINRTLMFCKNTFDGVVLVTSVKDLTENDVKLLASVNTGLKDYVDLMEKVSLREALKRILNISRHGNSYMQSQKPWVLVKEPGTQLYAHIIISLCVHVTHLLATLLQPFMPSTSSIILGQLNAKPFVITEQFTAHLPHGHKIDDPAPLFKRIDADFVTQLCNKYGGGSQKSIISKKSKKPDSTAPAAGPID